MLVKLLWGLKWRSEPEAHSFWFFIFNGYTLNIKLTINPLIT